MTIGIPPVRYSFLKLMAKSPAHYRNAVDTDTGGTIGRYTRERGSALHSILLGGPPVIEYTGKQRRGKAWEEFRKLHPEDAHILTAAEYKKTHAMAASVNRNANARALMKGSHEKELNWEWLGRKCQSHIDILGNQHIAELKSCESSSPERFRWMAIKYGYHAQLAFYRMAVDWYDGANVALPCYVIAVESAAPHPVSTFRLTEELLRKGEMLCRSWMEQLLVCEESNNWPGYTNAITDMDAPEDDTDIVFPDEVANG